MDSSNVSGKIPFHFTGPKIAAKVLIEVYQARQVGR